MRRTAMSKRGFNGPGGRIASLILVPKGASSVPSPHLLANFSDNFYFTRQRGGLKRIIALLTCREYLRIYLGVYLAFVLILGFKLHVEREMGLGRGNRQNFVS